MANEILLTGKSGQRYKFDLASVNLNWNPVPGVYIFVGPVGRVLYVGQTGNLAFRDPGPGHEKWDEARGYGDVLVYARVNADGEEARLAEETDLIRAYNPPCNVQNKLAEAFRQTRRF